MEEEGRTPATQSMPRVKERPATTQLSEQLAHGSSTPRQQLDARLKQQTLMLSVLGGRDPAFGQEQPSPSGRSISPSPLRNSDANLMSHEAQSNQQGNGSSETSVWQVAVSKTTGREYYLNPLTGESTYDKPEDLSSHEAAAPADAGSLWQVAVSTTTGREYYINTLTGESTYDKPEEMCSQESAAPADADSLSPGGSTSNRVELIALHGQSQHYRSQMEEQMRLKEMMELQMRQLLQENEMANEKERVASDENKRLRAAFAQAESAQHATLQQHAAEVSAAVDARQQIEMQLQQLQGIQSNSAPPQASQMQENMALQENTALRVELAEMVHAHRQQLRSEQKRVKELEAVLARVKGNNVIVKQPDESGEEKEEDVVAELAAQIVTERALVEQLKQQLATCKLQLSEQHSTGVDRAELELTKEKLAAEQAIRITLESLRESSKQENQLEQKMCAEEALEWKRKAGELTEQLQLAKQELSARQQAHLALEAQMMETNAGSAAREAQLTGALQEAAMISDQRVAEEQERVQRACLREIQKQVVLQKVDVQRAAENESKELCRATLTAEQLGFDNMPMGVVPAGIDSEVWAEACKMHQPARLQQYSPTRSGRDCSDGIDSDVWAEACKMHQPARLQQDSSIVNCGKCYKPVLSELVAPADNRFICDVCDEPLAVGAAFKSCQECNYDVCSQCTSRQDSVPREQPMSTIPVANPYPNGIFGLPLGARSRGPPARSRSREGNPGLLSPGLHSPREQPYSH